MISWSAGIDVLGWIGAMALLTAYALISIGSASVKGRQYLALNIGGGVLLAINGAWHHAWPSSILNLIWVAIALATIVLPPGYFRRKST